METPHKCVPAHLPPPWHLCTIIITAAWDPLRSLGIMCLDRMLIISDQSRVLGFQGRMKLSLILLF